MPHKPLTVLKFGGSVLLSEQSLSAAVQEVYRWVRRGHRVIAVVSALNGVTDRLLEQAKRFGPEPDPTAQAALLATGEAATVALLGLALDRAGIPANVLDHTEIGLIAEGSVLDANPIRIDRTRVESALEARPVAVVPGFVGRLEDGRTALLGRGGSDLTAVFIAQQLGAAQCRLIKDVDGLYERDPAKPGLPPRRFEAITFARALQLDGRVLQHKAVRAARDHGTNFEVCAPSSSFGTAVGGDVDVCADSPAPERTPLRIGLLGLGTVGLGVYRELAARPDLFEVVKIAVRRPSKHAGEHAPEDLLTTEPAQVLAAGCDVVIEALGGRQPAARLIESALRAGTHVITANKQVIAQDGARLRSLAAVSGARLLYSGAVGGATPILETLTRLSEEGRIVSVEGVVNGTTNFILDRLAEGTVFEAAVSAAQARGFAEVDPSDDLSGLDAAHKLAIIAAEGFGVDLRPEEIERTGIAGLEESFVKEAAAAGRVVRLIASVRVTPQGLRARVAPEALPLSHPLAGIRNEQNGAIITLEDGRTVFVAGKGAGRWPTTEAVIADLFDIVRERGAAAITEETGSGFEVALAADAAGVAL